METDYDSRVCIDCAMWIANGVAPEELSEEDSEAWVVEFDRIESGGRWVIESGEGAGESFSMNSCHSCNSGLGGNRFDAVWVSGRYVTLMKETTNER